MTFSAVCCLVRVLNNGKLKSNIILSSHCDDFSMAWSLCVANIVFHPKTVKREENSNTKISHSKLLRKF